MCFSGHRFISLRDREALKPLLDTVLLQALAEGKRVFLSGGAIGFDTLTAQAVLRLREREKDARLVLALPCREQADRWSDPDRKTWRSLLESADRVVYVSQEYFQGCMQKRNRFLVDHASACCCFMRTCCGGTWNTVSYAYDKGLVIRNLALEL